MCEVAGFKNFENSLTTVKFMTKTKVAPFYLGHGVVGICTSLKWPRDLICTRQTDGRTRTSA